MGSIPDSFIPSFLSTETLHSNSNESHEPSHKLPDLKRPPAGAHASGASPSVPESDGMGTGPGVGTRVQSTPPDDISEMLRSRWSEEAEIAVVWGCWAWAYSGHVLEKYADWPMLFHCGMTIVVVWLAGRSGINIFFVLCVALYYMYEVRSVIIPAAKASREPGRAHHM